MEGGKTKITQFQEMFGALKEFKTYLFMKKGSVFCTVIHLPMKFMALNEATQHLQGCFIGFIGDRKLTRDPAPILLSTQKTWQWVKEMVATDGPAIIVFCEEGVSWQGAFWTPAANCKKAEGHVPQLLHIPLVLFMLIRKEARLLMLHEVLAIMMKHLRKPGLQRIKGRPGTLLLNGALWWHKRMPRGTV